MCSQYYCIGERTEKFLRWLDFKYHVSIGRKGGCKKMANNVIKRAIAATMLVVGGGMVLFLGAMLVFGIGAAIGL